MGYRTPDGFLRPSLRDRRYAIAQTPLDHKHQLLMPINSNVANTHVYTVLNANYSVATNDTVIRGADVLDWAGFESWLLEKKLNRVYVRKLVILAEKWQDAFFSGRLSELERAGGTKHMVLSAFSQLSRFLNVYGDFRRLMEQSGLSWHSGNSDEVLSLIYGQEIEGMGESWRI